MNQPPPAGTRPPEVPDSPLAAIFALLDGPPAATPFWRFWAALTKVTLCGRHPIAAGHSCSPGAPLPMPLPFPDALIWAQSRRAAHPAAGGRQRQRLRSEMGAQLLANLQAAWFSFVELGCPKGGYSMEPFRFAPSPLQREVGQRLLRDACLFVRAGGGDLPALG